MKINFIKYSVSLAVAAILTITQASNLFAQSASANVTTTVTIANVAQIKGASPLNFGLMQISDNIVTATVNPEGLTSGSVKWADTGNVTAAEFVISGEQNQWLSIALPTGSGKLSNGANTITVSDITSNSGNIITLNENGAGTISIGATLTIAPNQAHGTYADVSNLAVTISF